MHRQNEALERLFKSICNTLLFLSLLVFFLALTMLVSLPKGDAGNLGFFTAIAMVLMMANYIGFRKKTKWAIRYIRIHWIFLMVVCAIIGLSDLNAGLNGDFISLALAVMLAMIVIGMYKRLPTFTNFLFLAWYHGENNILTAAMNLNEGEVVGACPECSSLLAVIPSLLSGNEICPHCGGRLVSQETIDKFAEEE